MSLDDSDAQKYINDAVKDGGGCTEAWEAMTEVRNQLDDNSRRKFLKRTAATAGIALTGVSTVSAKGREEHQELDVDIEYVLKSDQVQLILDELGHPTPQRVNDSNFSTKGPFDIQLDKVTSEMAISEEGSRAP